MNQDQFLLKWNNHQNNFVEVFSYLRTQVGNREKMGKRWRIDWERERQKDGENGGKIDTRHYRGKIEGWREIMEEGYVTKRERENGGMIKRDHGSKTLSTHHYGGKRDSEQRIH